MGVSLMFSQSISHLKEFNYHNCDVKKYRSIRDPMFEWQINDPDKVISLQDPNLYRYEKLTYICNHIPLSLIMSNKHLILRREMPDFNS